MSFGFEMDTRGQRETLGHLQQNIATPAEAEDEASPGFFAGTGGLFMSELASAGRSVAIAGGAIPAAIDWAVGDDNKSESLADRYFRAVDEPTKHAVEYWKPAPVATGIGGRVLGPVAGGLVQLAATGGNPALMITRQQIGTAGELVDQGVDATTAQLVGGAQGLATAAGFRLGTVGNTLGKQMATGAAGNLATNVPAAAASQAILEQGGFTEQAKQFNPWDAEARAIDLLMGAAFGAVAHYGPKPADAANTPRTDLPPSQQAEILAAAAARNWAVDTAPGRPATDADLAMHHNAMSTALDQMMRGEPVDVSAHIEGATFAPRADAPETKVTPALRSLLAEYSEADAIVNEASKLFGKDAFKDNVGFATPDDIKVAYDALLPIAGEKLKRGEVKQLNAELADLQQKRQAIVDTPSSSYKDTAKEALKGTRKKVKEALKLADDIRAQDLAPIDERIKAVEERLSKHDTSAQAEAMLSRIEQYKRSPAYVRAVEVSRTPEVPAADTTRAEVHTSRAEPDTTTAAQADTMTGSSVRTTAAAEEPEIRAARAAIERQPAGEMIDLGDADNPMLVDAREAMRQADEEMLQAKNDAEGFMAAVTCYLGG